MPEIAPLFRIHGAYDDGRFRVMGEGGVYSYQPIPNEDMLALISANRGYALHKDFPLVRTPKGYELNA